ncbi:MAG: Smr/MutS family protein [Proteobacteria bacterium]|nr:Smr/MutS family protein [Pseudomonadota bacterium]
MSNITEEARQLFRESLTGVTPLKQTARISKPTSDRLLKKRLRARRLGLIDSQFYALDKTESVERFVQAECALVYQRTNLANKQVNSLRKGQFATRCVIDLHGLNETQAEVRMQDWLKNCRHRTDRYALVIHGKGLGNTDAQPVLKNWLNWWLRNQPRILAFHTAQPNDGGAGALYLLLAPAQQNNE